MDGQGSRPSDPVLSSVSQASGSSSSRYCVFFSVRYAWSADGGSSDRVEGGSRDLGDMSKSGLWMGRERERE